MSIPPREKKYLIEHLRTESRVRGSKGREMGEKREKRGGKYKQNKVGCRLMVDLKEMH